MCGRSHSVRRDAARLQAGRPRSRDVCACRRGVCESECRGLRRLLLIITALTALAVSAAADVTLLAPRAGERLEGGSDATISWRAAKLPAHAEEWEAFLSVDGGKTYAVRITPHLDLRTRSFRFRVPNLAASNVRILIRVGDEIDERRVELPQTFSITPQYAALDLTERHVRDDAGSDGAAEWVASDLIRHRRAETSTSGAPRITAFASFDESAEDAANCDGCLPSASSERLASRPILAPQSSALPSRPILLLSTRLNV